MDTPEEIKQRLESNILPQLPNSTAVLVLGILSIVICCGIGIVLGIIALVMGGKPMSIYQENPGEYSPASYSNLKAGRICAIVGICLNVIGLLYYIVVILIFGLAAVPGLMNGWI